MQSDAKMLAMFKTFNRYMVLMWRLGLGRFINAMPEQVGRIMVLVHTGRKSGQARYTPVNFSRDGDTVYCMAGFGARTQWYQNLMATPQVEVWLPGARWQATATDVTNDAGRGAILRRVLDSSGFAAETFEGLDTTRLTDADLESLIAENGYRLVRIDKTADATGPGGPGSLAWVWPVFGAAGLLGILILRRLLR